METQNVKDTVRQIFTEYLTANGHRKTPERYAILETIYSIDGHFDIDMLYSRMMDQENFRVSRATLYNTIILLINARLIIKHQFGTSSQYETSSDMYSMRQSDRVSERGITACHRKYKIKPLSTFALLLIYIWIVQQV